MSNTKKSYAAGETSWEQHGNQGCAQAPVGQHAGKLAAIITCLVSLVGINLRSSKRTK